MAPERTNRASDEESSHSDEGFFSAYRARILKRARRMAGSFRIHAIAFGAANAFLLLINWLTGFSFPWFVFPFAGWAIGLATHGSLLAQASRQKREVSRSGGLPVRTVEFLRRLHRTRAGFSLHLTAAAWTSLFLVMTNLIVGGGFPWSAIPAGALGLSVLAHYLLYAPRRRWLTARIEGSPLIDEEGWSDLRPPNHGGGELDTTLSEAARLKEQIIGQLATLREDHTSLRDEIIPLLDRYLGQIAVLARQRAEIAHVAGTLGVDEAAQERRRLLSRLEVAQSEELKNEYRHSLEQLEAQQRSVQRLLEQKEIAELRIHAATSALRQLHVDIVRMKSQAHFDESAVFHLLEDKSHELSNYLEDLAKSRRELEE